MDKLNFSIQINACKTRVWKTLWDDASYRLWTSVFTAGSYAETDWQEGGKILFLNGKGSGMSSKIARLIPFEFMSFQHLGEVKDGVEHFSDDKAWSGAFENYSLRDLEAGTELSIEIDANNSFADYFKNIFPKALERVKELAEAQKITTFLTFDDQAEAAMDLYCSIFQQVKILSKNVVKGKFFSGSFQIDGQKFVVLNGGPHFSFAQGISLSVNCETQEEIDHLWGKLSEGGETMPCGWLTDRFGVSWQIVPSILGKLLGGADPVKSNNALQAMLKMSKFDIATLKQAYEQ